MKSVFIDGYSGDLKYQGDTGDPAILAEGDGSVHLVPFNLQYTGVSGLQSVDSSSYQSIGNFIFDPSALYDGNDNITRTVTFRGLIYGSTGVTASVRLYNLTDGGAVTGTELTSSDSSPDEVTASLVVGVALPNSSKLYEVQLKISAPLSPSPGDFAFCSWGGLIVNFSY